MQTFCIWTWLLCHAANDLLLMSSICSNLLRITKICVDKMKWLDMFF